MLKRFKAIVLATLVFFVFGSEAVQAGIYLERDAVPYNLNEDDDLDEGMDDYLDEEEDEDSWDKDQYEHNLRVVESWGNISGQYLDNKSWYIANLSNEIAGDISGDYEKMKAIYKWVTENIEYDHQKRKQPMYALVVTDDVYERFEAEGLNVYRCDRATQAAVLRKGICADFTWLIHDLLEAQHIPCENVSSETMNHSWNAAYIDGEWYFLDATWDAGMEEEEWENFTASLEEFSCSHFFE